MLSWKATGLHCALITQRHWEKNTRRQECKSTISLQITNNIFYKVFRWTWIFARLRILDPECRYRNTRTRVSNNKYLMIWRIFFVTRPTIPRSPFVYSNGRRRNLPRINDRISSSFYFSMKKHRRPIAGSSVSRYRYLFPLTFFFFCFSQIHSTSVQSHSQNTSGVSLIRR